jgi:hypothetical protein
MHGDALLAVLVGVVSDLSRPSVGAAIWMHDWVQNPGKHCLEPCHNVTQDP